MGIHENEKGHIKKDKKSSKYTFTCVSIFRKLSLVIVMCVFFWKFENVCYVWLDFFLVIFPLSSVIFRCSSFILTGMKGKGRKYM